MRTKDVARNLQLQECAQYLIDSERDDFNQYVLDGNDPKCHIYSVAYIALHSETEFDELVRELQAVS